MPRGSCGGSRDSLRPAPRVANLSIREGIYCVRGALRRRASNSAAARPRPARAGAGGRSRSRRGRRSRAPSVAALIAGAIDRHRPAARSRSARDPPCPVAVPRCRLATDSGCSVGATWSVACIDVSTTYGLGPATLQARRVRSRGAHDGRARQKWKQAIHGYGNDGLSGTPYRRSCVALVSWQPMQLATRPAAVTWPAGETVA